MRCSIAAEPWPALGDTSRVEGKIAHQQGGFARARNGIEAAYQEGRPVGGYRILREVGRGGMGIVYEAEQPICRGCWSECNRRGRAGYKEVSRAPLIEPTIGAKKERAMAWAHPAYANKHVFVRNDKELLSASLAAER